MATTEMTTPHEQYIIARREKVTSLYREIRDQFPDVSDNRIFNRIADEMCMSVPGVRMICIEEGATKPVNAQ